MLFLAAVIGAVIFAVSNTGSEVTSAHADPINTADAAPFSETDHVLSDNHAAETLPPGVNLTPETIVVHVTGEVHNPGVFEIEQGARVIDAITEAGGATDAAVLEQINLARVLGDGEQVTVPNLDNAAQFTEPSGAAEAHGAGTPISINTADASTLELLPGIGPALAQRIVQWRETHGQFTHLEQLLEVSGIGPSKFAELQDYIRM